jgi:para-nitrobenzyl esterase
MLIVRIALAVAFLTSVSAAAAAQPVSCTVSEADVVCTEQGPVRGVPEGDTQAFKGIPYAKPPIGTLRWRPPEAPARRDGIRDGSLVGAMCPQLAGKEVKGEEDCLYLVRIHKGRLFSGIGKAGLDGFRCERRPFVF